MPEEVREYCDAINLPLFTIPWETKMVDMTRDFCHRIMMNEQLENNMVTTLKNIIFNVGDIDAQVLQMERFGCMRDSRFCFVCLHVREIRSVKEESITKLKAAAEKAARNMHDFFISFTYNENRILVLVDYNDAEITAFIDDFLKMVKDETPELKLHLGLSSNQAGLYNQTLNFEKALSAVEMAKRRGETVEYYDKLGIYKVLYALHDKTILRGYYQEVIGKLEKYDRDNNTKLTGMLRSYLDNNGSLQLVSEKEYVHRNTVTNQLKKIESITGLNPFDLEDKVKFCTGFYIKDIL